MVTKTYGIGRHSVSGVQGDLDSDQIRDALLERLADSNQDVRDEAMARKRQEPRVLPSLVSALARPTVVQ
jgi:hypothetical protein